MVKPVKPGVALLSLVPWVAFLVAMTVTDQVGDESPVSLLGVLLAAPFYLGFVALPAFLPLATARHRATKIVVLAVMTGTAIFAGIAMSASDDAQAGLAVFVVSYVGVPLAGVVWIGQAVVPWRSSRPSGDERTGLELAGISDRLRALTMDVLLVGGSLAIPLTTMSHAGQEAAATAVGVAVGIAYTGVGVACRGRTIGQWLVGITVVDAETHQRLSPIRALVRGCIVVLELLGATTVVLSLPALAELLQAARTGRSLTDQVLHTSVMNMAATRATPAQSPAGPPA